MTDQCQHTPGPWRTGVPGRGRFCVYSVSAHGRGVCVMSNTVESPSDHELNLIADANARLIASAPNLLEAAKAAVAVLTQPAHYEADRVAAVTWLGAAIAAATEGDS